MTIHHATVKSAASKGVILTQDGDTVTALHAEANVRVTRDVEDETSPTDVAKQAWSEAQDIVDYRAEHPLTRIIFEDGDFIAINTKTDEEVARDPELADLIITLNEGGGDEIADEDEEDKATGSVVPSKYKDLYKAEGHANHCGDWMANTLNGLCRVIIDGKEAFDSDKLGMIAEANGVDHDKYRRNQSRGWEGRYRMTVRNVLAKVVAVKGVMIVPGEVDGGDDRELTPPTGWGAKYRKPEVAAPAEAKTVDQAKKGGAKKSK